MTSQPNDQVVSTDQPDSGSQRSSLLYGFVGGVVAVFLSFLPLSTVLGGGVAGYLVSNDGGHEATAGVVAGLVAFLPTLLVGMYLAASPTVSLPGPALGLSPAIVVAGVTVVALVYTVGLSVLGSLGGRYLHRSRSDSI